MRIDSTTERERAISAATAAARRGDVIVMPTESVYAVATDAFSPRGVMTLRTVKSRSEDVPLPVMIGSVNTLAGITTGVSPEIKALVDAFWPGPMTLVLNAAPTLAWDIGGHGEVSVRIPIHPVALAVLKKTGPMVVTAANAHGFDPPTTCDEAERQLGDDVAVYLDAGPLGEAGQPPATSCVIDVTGETPLLLRSGGYPDDVLLSVCPELVLSA